MDMFIIRSSFGEMCVLRMYVLIVTWVDCDT